MRYTSSINNHIRILYLLGISLHLIIGTLPADRQVGAQRRPSSANLRARCRNWPITPNREVTLHTRADAKSVWGMHQGSDTGSKEELTTVLIGDRL